MQVDLKTDAVWKRGEGDLVREREKEEKQDKAEKENKEREGGDVYGVRYWLRRVGRHVY